jgi:superfamily II DNA or RNA helicase
MTERLIGKRITIPGQFTGFVTVESAKLLENIWLLRVRDRQGELHDAYLTEAAADDILANQEQISELSVDANQFFLFIESARIKTGYDHDPHFAVSLSGVRPLPHQLEAVYERILPQVRLRFLLADDPGAGKTIMAGLLLKELKLRSSLERVLILAPAPLTLQWQDELRSKFSETFEVVNSVLAKGQLAGNPWERFRQCVASIDFAKRDDVSPSLLQVEWDLVIVDEAHKCSARTQGDDLRRTGRYKLVEELSRISERILLLTATPHQGNVDQFHNFLRLLDPEQFICDKLNPQILSLEDSPWFLRRIKEELVDFDGRKLFRKRYPITLPFDLSQPEQYLYDQVTKYINKYLGKHQGRKQATVALARTVLQRRLASSLNAIFNSLKKRQQRFANLLEELDDLSPAEQHQRLMNLGKPVDSEVESDDVDEEELEDLAVESTVAEKLEQLREELRELERLVKLTQQTIAIGTETKLTNLKECLERAEFSELKDGRGKLLIFTEHRDTLEYLKHNLNNWGYSTCEIHGGMNPLARKDAQKDFQFNKQICLATEAAGEGINLQFCRLMINYDLPWNPNRLEQRMGRIHRIGQNHDVYIFNFIAVNTVEGRVLDKLLQKLEEIRKAMGDRVFDVIGQLLQLNEIQFEEMLREATYAKAAEEHILEQIEKLDPKRLEALEQATGVALATTHIDLSCIRRTQEQDYISQEQRLMPRYVEEFFKRACEFLRVNLETRADGLWRIPYVKEEFRSGNLDAVRRLGTPEKNYPKLTFYKEHLTNPTHQDADLVSPGHPLFAALAERLDAQLNEQICNSSAIFMDADTDVPYRLHFFEVQVAGQQRQGKDVVIKAQLCALKETATGKFALVASDCLHDLAPFRSPQPPFTRGATGDHPTQPPFTRGARGDHPTQIALTNGGLNPVIQPPTPQEQQQVEEWLKVKVQFSMIQLEQQNRHRELQIRQDYLTQAMESKIREEQSKQMKLAAKVAAGDETYRVARDNAQKKVRELQERYKTKQTELDYLKIVRPGRVIYLGTALVHPASAIVTDCQQMRNDPEVEAFAMQWVMNYERERGWQPYDISQERDGSGFDIRSIKPADPETGKSTVRRIEVKGRAQLNQPVSLTVNEWRKAQQLGDSYWLYIVWGCKTPHPQLLTIQNPAKKLVGDAKEIKQVTRYLVGAEALVRCANC